MSQGDIQPRQRSNLRWWMLFSVMLGTMAALMASTIVNVALPEMSREFALTPSRAQWMPASFLAAMTVAMMTTPRLLENLGYRRTYLSAVLLLMVASAVGGLSPWYELVIATRVVEGWAAGVLQPIPAIIVMRAFQPAEQGKALGIFGLGALLAPALGPSVGGALVEWLGWRAIFFIVIPPCIIAMFMGRRFLPDVAPGGVATGSATGRMDLIGLGLLSVAILCLLSGLARLHDSSLVPAAGLLLLATAISAAFVWRQKTVASPLVRLDLFTQRPFGAAFVVAFLFGAGVFASTYLLPVFMQTALHIGPLQAGAVMLPAGLALALTNPLAGRLADRQAPQWLIAGGLVLMALSFLAMNWVDMSTALLVVTALTVLGRIGLALSSPALNLVALRALPREQLSYGSSSINFGRQLGGMAGVSLAGVALQWRLTVAGVSGPAVAALQHQAQLRAFQETFVLLALPMAAAAVVAIRLRPRHVA